MENMKYKFVKTMASLMFAKKYTKWPWLLWFAFIIGGIVVGTMGMAMLSNILIWLGIALAFTMLGGFAIAMVIGHRMGIWYDILFEIFEGQENDH